MSAPPDPADLLPAIIEAAQSAGETALAFFRPGAQTSARVQSKAGGSPVTEADHAVDRMLFDSLRGLDPSAGWLSEETADTPDRLEKSRVFIVDPIDGTRGFVAGDMRWGVSIALVIDGAPALGVLHMPALGVTFSAKTGGGAWQSGGPGQDQVALRVSDAPTLARARVAGQTPLIQRLARSLPDLAPQPKVPSLAYRIALVAKGDIEVGLASTNAHDWDIAAADLIVHEAGGFLVDTRGRRPVYNQSSTKHGVLAAAPERFRDDLIPRLQAMS